MLQQFAQYHHKTVCGYVYQDVSHGVSTTANLHCIELQHALILLKSSYLYLLTLKLYFASIAEGHLPLRKCSSSMAVLQRGKLGVYGKWIERLCLRKGRGGRTTWDGWVTVPIPLKFIYSEKATKFYEISTIDLSYVVPVKSTVEILQNFGPSQNI